jgi:TolA-binding protein
MSIEKTLQDLIKTYPDSPAAETAKERLKAK